MISTDRLRDHVAALVAQGPRCGDLPGVPAALRYIADQLSGLGLAVRVERYGGELNDVNLVAEIEGGTSDDAVELCAHWDTVEGTPGADDNASGVAGVLEAARALRELDLPARTIRFCLFGGEESDFRGSAAHVQRITPGTESIIFEMIGRTAERQSAPAFVLDPPERGDFIALLADPTSAVLADAYAAAADRRLPTLPLIVPVEVMHIVLRSDHVPYWQAGHRSLLVTDTAQFRNLDYHLPGDTLDRLDLGFAALVTEAAVRTIGALAG